MSVVDPSDAHLPSSHSVDYLYGTNPQEEGEVISYGVRENPVTIDSDGLDLVDYGTSEKYPNFWEDDRSMQNNPNGNRTEGDGGRMDGTLTGRSSSPPNNAVGSPIIGPSQTNQTATNSETEQSLRDQVAFLTTGQQQLLQQPALITKGLHNRTPSLGDRVDAGSGSVHETGDNQPVPSNPLEDKSVHTTSGGQKEQSD